MAADVAYRQGQIVGAADIPPYRLNSVLEFRRGLLISLCLQIETSYLVALLQQAVESCYPEISERTCQ